MIDTSKYEGHTEGTWTLEEREDDEGHQWFEVPAVSYTTKLSGDGSQQEFADAKLIADAPLLLAEVKRLREELFNTHAFYSNMEQMLAFAVGIKQGLLPDMSMDDLVDAVNRDFHDRLNEHMDGRLRE